MLKLIIDENIAFADKAFEQFGEVTLLPGREITNSILRNADIMIVRSITNVHEELLIKTSVKFVGTATIGTDHIDLDYLSKNKIAFADAKGCNAYSVAEYIFAALLNLSVQLDFRLNEKSIGIVGVGNVGSKVATFAEALGMKGLLNDPPLKRKGDNRNFVDLDEILKCDIITIHTPLNLNGNDKTYHLFNNENLNKLQNDAILINSSRGAVVNNSDLLNSIKKKKLKVVLDVWENEPDINVELLKMVLVGTPHIAGYSYEGKVNGTKMIYDSLCEFLGMKKTFLFDLPAPIDSKLRFIISDKIETAMENLVSNIYAINNDDIKMREMITMEKDKRIKHFDLQRKIYPKRREFNNYIIEANNISKSIKDILKKLRFNLST